MNAFYFKLRGCFVVMLALGLSSYSFAEEYFVSPHGSDDNTGTIEKPFATLKKAASVLEPGDACYLREGVYREVLRPMRSGEAGKEITFSNWKNETVVITGAEVLSEWKQEENGVYSAAMSWSLGNDNQFFIGEQMLTEACWPAPGDEPLFQPKRAVASGGSAATLVCEDLTGDDDAWKGARLWCAGGKSWYCWSSEVTSYDAETHTLTFKDEKTRFYIPEKGNLFVLKGLRDSLHAPGQWFYDDATKRLLIIPPEDADSSSLKVEAKRRIDAIDLTGLSHIHIKGIHFKAAGIRTNSESSHIVLEGLNGRYVSHSNSDDVSNSAGVLLLGNHILLLNCKLGYSSGSVVTVKGHDNRVINCFIHRGNYLGSWSGTVKLSGCRQVFSHNTVRHAGRDLISTHGLMQSLIQYNDVSDAGWLTKDLAMFYGHNTDFAGTEFRFNLVHDNQADHIAMGIYFDHLSHNAIVHHNVIWNIGMDPTRFNNPGYCNLVFNNTCVNTGKVSTFDHSKRDDLYASRYFNNVYNETIDLPEHVLLYGNEIIESPSFRNPDQNDYRLNEEIPDDVGAYAPDGVLWQAGCDFDNPPNPLPAYSPPRIDGMNLVTNACFEYGTLEGWVPTDQSDARLVEGNGWGNSLVGNTGEPCATGTSHHELRLGSESGGVHQTLTGLSPNRSYTFAVWGKASNSERLVFGVEMNDGSKTQAEITTTRWSRNTIQFTTDAETDSVMIYLLKPTDTDGYVWADNLTVQANLPVSMR